MKTLDLDTVRAFVLTAELHSFTRAAQALDSTQSAVSLKLRKLEAQLGRRLLERTPRQVRLSAEGALFLESARELIAAHERAIASFEIEERRLIVGISHQLVGAELPGMLRRLCESDPKLRIELRAGGSREIVQSYDAGELDAALVLQAAAPHHKGERLFDEAFAWIGAAGWHPREGQPLPLSTQGASCSIRAAAVTALDRAGIAWTEAFVGKGAAMVGAAAAAGLAIAVMARRAAPAGTEDLGSRLSLPELHTQEAVLYSALHDRRSRAALRTLADAFRTMAI
ncbi:LysR family transcriptional regulator [Dyella ginsengisoli]|uniref:LysR family transcriptional regulator n=1 Tax=Dyella ginsengisoli TaxID=363848 RepID=A0ABW8JQU7_9GAMM